jgi:hypothetical protein
VVYPSATSASACGARGKYGPTVGRMGVVTGVGYDSPRPRIGAVP